MTTLNAIVKARVDPALKEQSERVFQQMGLDMTAGIKMYLTQVVLHQAIPFEVKLAQPNARTLQAIADSYAGNVEAFESVEAMLADADN